MDRKNQGRKYGNSISNPAENKFHSYNISIKKKTMCYFENNFISMWGNMKILEPMIFTLRTNHSRFLILCSKNNEKTVWCILHCPLKCYDGNYEKQKKNYILLPFFYLKSRRL